MRNEKVAILGAGIGGITLAAFLQKLNVPCHVYEQAEQLGEVGAGLGLWSNATRWLREIGIETDFWSDHGCEVHTAQIANAEGRVLSHCDVRPVTARVGSGSFVVHRADLHRAISRSVPDSSVSTGKRLISFDRREDETVLQFADGSEDTATIVIGADGLRSRVRAELFGDTPPDFAGQVCYRGIAQLHVRERHVLREIQGPGGLRAAVIPLDDQRVYWWTTENASESGAAHRTPEDEKSHLQAAYAGWAFGVPEAIEATAAEAILRNDLFDRPPLSTWSQGNVALLGDAAHPTTPNLGQGACMAIEDAAVLGHLLAKEKPGAAFSRYETLRKAHCESIVKESRRFGWIGGWSHPLASRFREMLLSATPELLVRKSMEKHINVTQPL